MEEGGDTPAAAAAAGRPRRKEARTSSEHGTAVTLALEARPPRHRHDSVFHARRGHDRPTLEHAESSFASLAVSIASSDHAIEVAAGGGEGAMLLAAAHVAAGEDTRYS